MLTTTKDSIDSAAYTLPCYWKQGRFLQDRMLHPEASVQPNGYAAEHLAYSMKGDDAINITVIACCLVIMILIRKTRTFLSGQTHDFFLPTHQEKNLQGTTTAIERSMPLFLVIILGILGSMLFYYYRQEVLGTRMPGNMPPHPLCSHAQDASMPISFSGISCILLSTGCFLIKKTDNNGTRQATISYTSKH